MTPSTGLTTVDPWALTPLTEATTDEKFIATWLDQHSSSPHTRRAYERIGRRFVEAVAAAGTSLKLATVLASSFMAALRSRGAGKSRKNCGKIPHLGKHWGSSWLVIPGRFWHPSTEEIVRKPP